MGYVTEHWNFAKIDFKQMGRDYVFIFRKIEPKFRLKFYLVFGSILLVLWLIFLGCLKYFFTYEAGRWWDALIAVWGLMTILSSISVIYWISSPFLVRILFPLIINLIGVCILPFAIFQGIFNFISNLIIKNNDLDEKKRAQRRKSAIELDSVLKELERRKSENI